MKITWFGGETVRIHVAGRILVWHPAPLPGVAAEELTSGADEVFGGRADLAPVDPAGWQPRRAPTALEGDDLEVAVLRAHEGAILVDAPGDAPLLVLSSPLPTAGRWSSDAIVVAFTPDAARAALETLKPRLIALAFEGEALETVFAELRDHLGGTALSALEPGLALEV